MKTLMKTGLGVAAAALVASGCVSAQSASDERSAIEAQLSAYETALNASDTDAVMALYAEDGVFMPQHSLPNVGPDAVRNAYDGVFSAITLDIEFIVDEIEQLSPSWAFARTRSEGFVTINETGDRFPESNQEVFLLEKTDDEDWKIARYIFSTTNPPRP